MKKHLLLIYFVFALVFPILTQNLPNFPIVTPAGKGIVNTRIDDISYWKKMLKLGYIKALPAVPVQKAIKTTSIITGKEIVTQDSPDIPVTNDTNTTQTENSVFIDPWNEDIVLNSNNSTDWDGSSVVNAFGADGLFSFNGGIAWGGSQQAAGQANSGDPATAIGLNGWWYVGAISNTWGQGVAYSTDQGNNWNYVDVATVPPSGNDLLDKNHLWIDTKPSSPYEGFLYDAWMNAVETSINQANIELSHSEDHGLTWSSAINISAAVNAGSHNQGVNINTGPDGEVYAVWAIYDDWPVDESALGFAKSINGGAIFTPATRIIDNIKGIRISGTSKSMRVSSFPSMTVDNSNGPYSGNIYVVWPNHGYPGVNTGPDINVYMIRSSDGGTTWSSPIKVNQDPPGHAKQHYLCWITCDPETGTLAVIYYDDRNVSATQCETWVSYSYDGGDTWQDIKVSDVSFTPTPLPGLGVSYFGDYLGISARNMKVCPVWTDNRSGIAMSYTSPFFLGPAPGQAYVVYNSSALSLISDHSATNLNYGDSLYLTVGLKNIGDRPVQGVTTFLSSASSFIEITDSTENYGDLDTAQVKIIPDGFSFKVSDTIPDGLNVKFTIRITNGDSTWYSNFTVEAHARAMKIVNISIIDSSGNNNGRLDPGENAVISITVKNTGDFPCENAIANLVSLSDYIEITSDIAALGTLQPDQSAMANFTISVAGDATTGSYADLTVHKVSGSYNQQETFREGIGQLVEDWETNTFTKFPWDVNTTHPWSLIDAGAYEGHYAVRSGLILDNQQSELKISCTAGTNDSISFFLFTSTEFSYDLLHFYIDSVLMKSWSGETPWEREAFPVSAGLHTFHWIYSKDFFNYLGGDCCRLDWITFPAPPLPAINPGTDATICTGDQFLLQGTASNYDSLHWTTTGDGNFSNDSIIRPVYTPGTIDIINGWVKLKLTGYGQNGHVRKSMLLTIGNYPVLHITAFPGDTLCAGHTAILRVDSLAGGHYLWIPGNLTTNVISVDTSLTGGINATWIKVFVTNQYNCTRSDSILITFKDCTGIEERGNPFELTVFPNPNKGIFTLFIQTMKPETLGVRIITPLNITIFEEKNIGVSGKLTKEFNIKYLLAGIYFLEIQRSDGTKVTEKIMIE